MSKPCNENMRVEVFPLDPDGEARAVLDHLDDLAVMDQTILVEPAALPEGVEVRIQHAEGMNALELIDHLAWALSMRVGDFRDEVEGGQS